MTVTSQTTIATAHASRYLQQLCKHFAHKIPVEFDQSQGAITFPIGGAALSANAEALRISVTTPHAEQIAQLQDVVIRHLERFAFREELAVAWSD